MCTTAPPGGVPGGRRGARGRDEPGPPKAAAVAEPVDACVTRLTASRPRPAYTGGGRARMRACRRGFLQAGLALAGVALLSACSRLPLGVGQPDKVHRIGLLAPDSAETAADGVK